MHVASTNRESHTCRWKLQTSDGTDLRVSDKYTAEADQIDTNHDGVCSDREIEAWLRARHIIKQPPAQADVPRIIEEFKNHLQDHRLPTAGDYHSFGEITATLSQLAHDHPDRAQLVSIGKTFEGRDLWALKITSNVQQDTSGKPGVVVTGTHHAREWMSPEVTLKLAEDLANNYDTDADTRRRLDKAELWIIPVANPDGFEYSRARDNWWRKNRTPTTDTGCPAGGDPPGGDPPTSKDGPPVAYGVDLNRNYWDGNPAHLSMYRTVGDKPCDTSDDYGASDDPKEDDYRGPRPASEVEVQALTALEYGHANIHGVLDHHSYGNELLRPWGHIPDPPSDVKDYDDVGARMVAAQGDLAFDYHQSYEDYPTCGSSETFHEANGRYNFTIEMGTSFQPSFDTFPDIYKAVSSADLAFVDWIVEKFPQVPPPPPAPVPPVPPAPPPVPARVSGSPRI